MKKEYEPWHPPHYELADAVAIQAVAAGTADEGMQRRAMKYLIETMCATYDLSFQPDSERTSAFAEGRRFVGLQLVKLIKLNTSLLARTKRDG